MQLRVPGIVVDYADDQWVVEDEQTGIVAYTNDPSAIYSIVEAFGRVNSDPPPDPTGTRDSGDEDPHA